MRKNDCVQQQQPLHTTTSSSSQMKLLEPYIVRYWFWEIEAVLLQIRQDRDWTDWIQLHHWALLSLALRRAVAGHTAASNRSQHLSNPDQADLSLFLSQTHRTRLHKPHHQWLRHFSNGFKERAHLQSTRRERAWEIPIVIFGRFGFVMRMWMWKDCKFGFVMRMRDSNCVCKFGWRCVRILGLLKLFWIFEGRRDWRVRT